MTDTTTPDPEHRSDPHRSNPTGSDLDVLAVVRVVDRTARRMTRAEQLIDDLAADVVTLASRDRGPAPGAQDRAADGMPAASPAGGSGDDPEIRSWLLSTDPDQARADLSDLIEWLHRVYLRYDGAGLCSCWLWHPDVIEELWWLRQAHADAYDADVGSWLRVADWHERHRPGVVKRIGAVVRRCELSLHAAGAELDHPAAAAPLAVHTDQIATAWTTQPGRPVPLPNAVQLDEAERAARAAHRARR